MVRGEVMRRATCANIHTLFLFLVLSSAQVRAGLENSADCGCVMRWEENVIDEMFW